MNLFISFHFYSSEHEYFRKNRDPNLSSLHKRALLNEKCVTIAQRPESKIIIVYGFRFFMKYHKRYSLNQIPFYFY